MELNHISIRESDKDLPGFDFTAFFARGGYLENLRQKSDVPMNVVPGLGDHNVGINLAAGVLASLMLIGYGVP